MHNNVEYAFKLLVLVAACCTSARAAIAQPASGGTAQVQSRKTALKDHIGTTDAGTSDRTRHSAALSASPASQRHASMTGQQLPSAVPATSPQDAGLPNFHLKRHLVVTCTIHLVALSSISTSNTTTTPSSSKQKQNLLQHSHIRIRAHLATLHNLQPGSPSPTPQIGPQKSSTTVVAQHSYKASTAAAQPLQLALLASLPNANSSRSSDSSSARAAVQQPPLLLTVHITQRISGRVYLWTDSQVILPGTATASFQANMSHSSYSWTLKQRQQTNPTVTPTAAMHSNAPPAAAEHLAAVPVSSSKASADSNKTSTDDGTQKPNLHQTCRNNGASKEQLQGPSVPAASICPALQQHLTDCAAASAAKTAYAVAGLFDRQPAHAAWSAAVLNQNNAHQHDLLKQLQQERPAGLGHSPDSFMHSIVGTLSNHVCPAWPAVYDLQQLSPNTASHVTTVATVPAAAHAAAQQDDSSSSSRGDMLWAAVAPYLQPHVTYNSDTQSVTISAPFEYVAMGLGGLLLATAVLTAVMCRSSSKQQRTAAPAVATAAALCAAANPGQNDLQQLQQVAADKTCPIPARRQSSRQSNRDQGMNDAGDFSLFGRSALNQMDEQQHELDSPADNDADDDLFGYTGAAAVAPRPTATQGATAAAAVARAVRRASAQAATALRAAAGTKHLAGNAGSNFSPHGTFVRGHNATVESAAAAVAIPNTAAKLAAGYWDSADEDAVNQLPANIQEHLQAAGRWQRETGGRLIRGSLRAFKVASNVAAAAVAAALSGGRAGQQQQQGDDMLGVAGVGSRGKDGELLSRLIAAGPGAELALSDEDE